MPIHTDIKYINMLSPRLDRFKWKRDSRLAACRCPVCGDSRKNANVCRFYFYERKGSFSVKCHNCGYGASLSWFLKERDPDLHRQYAFETLGERDGTRASVRAPERESAPPREADVGPLSLLPRLDSLPSDHPAVAWATGRRIPRLDRLYYAEDYGAWAVNIDPEMRGGKDPRIVIPIIDHAGRLVGAQGRVISTSRSASQIRYLTVKADPDADKAWYGMDVVNPQKAVVVVEGPIDSLFLDNGVAMVGLSNALPPPPQLSSSQMVYALDNEPRNAQVVEAMGRIADAGHAVCVWSDRVTGYKDINDMILSGMQKPTIMSEIQRNSHRGIAAHVAIRRWAK